MMSAISTETGIPGGGCSPLGEGSSSAAHPEVRGWPIVGVLPMLLRDPIKFLFRCQQQYGDAYYIRVGSQRFLILCHPRHAEYVFARGHRVFRKKGSLWKPLRHYLGNGLLVSDGDFWLRQRRLMQPLFSSTRLNDLTELMVTTIDEGLSSWDKAAESTTPIDVEKEFGEITMQVSARVMFGAGMPSEQTARLGSDVSYIIDHMVRSMVTDSFPRWLPRPGRVRYHETLKRVRREISSLIEQCRQPDAQSGGMLYDLIRGVDGDPGDQMTPDELYDEAMNLFLGGYQTTAFALAWTVHFLTLYPEWHGRLQQEVDVVLAGRTPVFEDLPKLSSTRMAIQEAMRLRSPAWWIPRQAEVDEAIDGIAVAAGTTVAPLVHAIHHHQDVWENPSEFDPARFTSERSEGRSKFAWLPFGAGPRRCVGERLSIAEAQLFIVRILQRFDLEAVPGKVARPRLRTTLGPVDGVHVFLRPRTAYTSE